MVRLHQRLASASSGLFLGLLVGCAGSGDQAGGAAAMEENAISHVVSAEDRAAARSSVALASDSVVLWVNGLGCPLCASNIDKQLIRVKGVSKVDVDLGHGKVTLALDPGAAHPSPARLGEAVEDAGFTLVKVEQR